MQDSQPVAVVLGAGPGLGAALARRFARHHYAVGLMARQVAGLSAIAAQLPEASRVETLCVDATDEKSVQQGFSKVRDTLGAINVLVYNAGIFEFAGLLDTDAETFERCWRINCLGGFLAARAVLPDMLSNGAGTILLTGATASVRGSACFANLAVGKFGLRALAQSMAREFGPRGIHVAHVVIDGQIATPSRLHMEQDRDPATLLDPDAIAECYWQLHCQSPRSWTLEMDLRPAKEKF